MAALFSPPSLPSVPMPPSVPTIALPSVAQAASDAVKKQAMGQGKASTYLTDLQAQRSAQASQQRYLGMG